jgi:hypothetical protein
MVLKFKPLSTCCRMRLCASTRDWQLQRSWVIQPGVGDEIGYAGMLMKIENNSEGVVSARRQV